MSWVANCVDTFEKALELSLLFMLSNEWLMHACKPAISLGIDMHWLEVTHKESTCVCVCVLDLKRAAIPFQLLCTFMQFVFSPLLSSLLSFLILLLSIPLFHCLPTQTDCTLTPHFPSLSFSGLLCLSLSHIVHITHALQHTWSPREWVPQNKPAILHQQERGVWKGGTSSILLSPCVSLQKHEIGFSCRRWFMHLQIRPDVGNAVCGIHNQYKHFNYWIQGLKIENEEKSQE